MTQYLKLLILYFVLLFIQIYGRENKANILCGVKVVLKVAVCDPHSNYLLSHIVPDNNNINIKYKRARQTLSCLHNEVFNSKILLTLHLQLLLTVYYESKCPDSKSFILRQLEPAYNLLHPYIRLKMIPFGKAQSINYGDDGFECQHGPSECMGNIVQDCALHHMRGRSDAKLLAYVACEMKTEAAARGDFYCVERAGLSTSTIGHCAMSGQGVALQMESEYYTNLLRPKFIPTITINGVFDQHIQNDAQRDLLGTLCSILTEAPPCARYHNKVAMNHLLYSNGPTYYLNSGYLTK